MRRLFLAAPLTLVACATTPAETPLACQASGADQFIGQPGTSETGAAIMHATHSSVLRWAPPGTMLTMDFSPMRVTVRLGPDGKVTAINCG